MIQERRGIKAHHLHMPQVVHELVRDAAAPFLRGETSVIDFTYAFRAAVDQVTQTRPLHGQEVDLFFALESWESAGWAERLAAVDRLRSLVASINDAR